MIKQNDGVVEPIRRRGVHRIRKRWPLRKHGADPESAVPQSPVMGADVAHHAEMVKKGRENVVVELIGSSDLLLVARGQIADPLGNLPQRKDFGCHPDRRLDGIGVLSAIVVEENVSGTPDFLGKLRLISPVPLFVDMVRGVEITVRPMLHGHVVGPGGPDGDFHTFDSVQHQQTKLAVEDIQAQDVFEARPVGEGMVTEDLSGTFERDPIAAQSIIADMGQVVTSQSAVREDHPSPFQ